MKVYVVIDPQSKFIHGCFKDKERAKRFTIATSTTFIIKKLKVYK